MTSKLDACPWSSPKCFHSFDAELSVVSDEPPLLVSHHKVVVGYAGTGQLVFDDGTCVAVPVHAHCPLKAGLGAVDTRKERSSHDRVSPLRAPLPFVILE